jgi:hypothetical protein
MMSQFRRHLTVQGKRKRESAKKETLFAEVFLSPFFNITSFRNDNLHATGYRSLGAALEETAL